MTTERLRSVPESIFPRHIDHIYEHTLARFLQLVAVDVILKHCLLKAVTDESTEGTNSVTLLMLLQLISVNAGEALLAVPTHQGLLEQK